jgi:hypothetical protein
MLAITNAREHSICRGHGSTMSEIPSPLRADVTLNPERSVNPETAAAY